MAVETLEFNYPPKSYSLQFKNLIDVNKEWVFQATMTKSGKKMIVYSYSRMLGGRVVQDIDGKQKKQKVMSPIKSINDLTNLILFSIKQGYKLIAKLTGVTPDD